MSSVITPHPHRRARPDRRLDTRRARPAHRTPTLHQGRALTWWGTIVAAMPIVLGLAAGVAAIYTPLFGGIENILSILWLVPLLASPLAILGAALLLSAVRAERRPRNNVITAATVVLLGLALTVALFVRTGTVTDLQALAGLPTHPPDLAGTRLLAFELVAGTLALMYDIGVWALVGLGARHLHGEPDGTR